MANEALLREMLETTEYAKQSQRDDPTGLMASIRILHTKLCSALGIAPECSEREEPVTI